MRPRGGPLTRHYTSPQIEELQRSFPPLSAAGIDDLILLHTIMLDEAGVAYRDQDGCLYPQPSAQRPSPVWYHHSILKLLLAAKFYAQGSRFPLDAEASTAMHLACQAGELRKELHLLQYDPRLEKALSADSEYRRKGDANNARRKAAADRLYEPIIAEGIARWGEGSKLNATRMAEYLAKRYAEKKLSVDRLRRVLSKRRPRLSGGPV